MQPASSHAMVDGDTPRPARSADMTRTTSEPIRLHAIARLLREAEQPVRVLRTIAWPPEVRERFFAAGARRLPEVSYPLTPPGPTLGRLRTARRLMRPGASPADDWLGRQADAIETSAAMLASLGSQRFHEHSATLYGTPRAPLPDDVSSPYDLAVLLDSTLATLSNFDLGAPEAGGHDAEDVAERMRRAVQKRFGTQAPQVVVVDHLSANAIAGPRAIRIRRTASFTDRDVFQLIHHEAFIHVATFLNGRAQTHLPILGAAHAGTTRTQEGLAVFAEFISGSMEPHRLRRLAQRVLAIQMAIEGADFLDVYRFFQERIGEDEQAFESTRRVFRGGLLTGGAPFTKDIVYLDGLLRVHNFLRAAVTAGRSDCLRLLFCGKLALDDLPALGQLAAQGLCKPPLFLPPWADDIRFLVCYLAYSSFLNRVEMAHLSQHTAALLAATPPVEWSRNG